MVHSTITAVVCVAAFINLILMFFFLWVLSVTHRFKCVYKKEEIMVVTDLKSVQLIIDGIVFQEAYFEKNKVNTTIALCKNEHFYMVNVRSRFIGRNVKTYIDDKKISELSNC